MACEKEEHLVNKNNEQLPQNPKGKQSKIGS